MQDKEKEYFSFLFQMMIKNYEQTTYISLGKLTNPHTGKVEKNLNDAKLFIDMLMMIKERTDGNLSDPEKSSLEIILTNLQLNYLEESKKSAEQEDKKPEEKVKKQKEKEKDEDKSKAEKKGKK